MITPRVKATAIAFALIFTQQAYPQGFADIVGQVPYELIDIAYNLSDKDITPDANLPKGIILVGKPGTGKTSLFRALSQELPPNSFVYNSAINLGTPENVDEFFKIAEQMAAQNFHGKCVVMIDDFDVFGVSNNIQLNQGNTPNNVVALMNQLSGFKRNDNLIVIVASHNINLHQDLGRSLKLDEVIELSLPDLTTRIDMLNEFGTGQKAFAHDVNLEQLAMLSYDFSPADLCKTIQKANLLARQASSLVVTQQHLIDALKGILIAKGRFDKDIIIRIKALTNFLNGKKEPCGFERIVGTVPQAARQLVEQINGSSTFDRFGLKPSKGILFSGPPGTGKTTIARAIAEEANCAFLSISGAEFSQALVGAGAEKVKELFKDAREKARNHPSGKAIIFIDELDSVGQRNGNSLDTTITQLLTEMDGFAEENNITVIAATNHPENIDSALLRPGRFDKIIEIGVPDESTRRKMLDFYIKNRPYNKQTIDLQKIAEFTNNYTPAELKESLNKAALLAVEEHAHQIEREHIIKALEQGLHEKILKGDENARQMLDRLDVVFSGKVSTKGFNQIIGGVPNAIKDMVQQMQTNPELAQQLDLELPKGYLLTGPPGTGKTLLAKAISEEMGCAFIATSGSAFVEQFVGLGAKRVRDLFKDAREKAKGNKFGKTIIFIDEIDALGKRSNNGFQSEETTRTINEFLAQMDGIAKDNSYIVIAATNNPNNIDDAIKSRLEDGIVEVPLPDHTKRIALLQYCCKKRKLNGVDFAALSERMDGFNAREIKQLCKSAARNALRQHTATVTHQHFEDALNDMLR